MFKLEFTIQVASKLNIWFRLVSSEKLMETPIIGIPTDVADSRYTGDVFKRSVLSPHHRIGTCQNIMNYSDKFIFFLYSDGGRVTYISVQLSLIAVFLRLDLEYLCASVAILGESSERIMQIVNLGRHCVGLMRQEL